MSSRDWLGESPYYLMFKKDGEQEIIIIDLDEHGWLSRSGWIFRTQGELHLVRKVGGVVVFSVRLLDGDQGYYVARHIGVASGVGTSQNEVVAFSIGKKRVDGNQDNLWYLPWGQICGGNDVEYFAMQGLKKGLNKV